MLELLAIGIALIIGFLLQMFATSFYLRVILFCSVPITTFLLLLPLPNGSTAFTIFKKFFKFQKSQKNFKLK